MKRASNVIASKAGGAGPWPGHLESPATHKTSAVSASIMKALDSAEINGTTAGLAGQESAMTQCTQRWPTPSTPSNTSSSGRSSQIGIQDAKHIIEIASHGDLVLRFEHKNGTSTAIHSFRVGSPKLKSNSKYFERLLQLDRFGEAVEMEAKKKTTSERYGSTAEAPSDELPVLDIQDVGRISAVRAVDALLTDFLDILHGKDTQTLPPVANLANLAIVADRFDAINVASTYIKRKKMIRAIDGKMTEKANATLSEEKVRQRVLVGLLLDQPAWVGKYTRRLITKGWVGKEANDSSPLWWDLPARVEEEIAYRRECVVETIQSIPLYFIKLYTSRERQCKLGYDSSPQCDSYQLGEMIRFFARIDVLQFQGSLIDTNESPIPYTGDIINLLDTLRQAPEYQIDKFHAHCGIRTRMLPLLDFLQALLPFVGLDGTYWQERREEYAWIESKKPLLWKHGDSLSQSVRDFHADIRAVFTAQERQWIRSSS